MFQFSSIEVIVELYKSQKVPNGYRAANNRILGEGQYNRFSLALMSAEPCDQLLTLFQFTTLVERGRR